jgi:hypothetical protein
VLEELSSFPGFFLCDFHKQSAKTSRSPRDSWRKPFLLPKAFAFAKELLINPGDFALGHQVVLGRMSAKSFTHGFGIPMYGQS